MRGGGGRGKHGGLSSELTGAQKVAERWHVGGEGGSGESSSAGSLEALKQGKEEWGRNGERSGCRGTLL
jgi:hypothetical protein